MPSLIFHSLPRLASSSTTSAVICHVLASRSDQNNAFGERIPVPTALNIYMWNHVLLDYDDEIVVEFFNYGWPINYKSHQLQQSTQHTLPSALAFSDHVRAYIKAELSFTTIAGPFQKNPLHQHPICFPLQTVPKRGSTKRQAVMDLSYPPSFSVDSGISSFAYLDSPFKLRLLEIDRLREFILSKGRGFHVFKRDL